MPLRDIWKEISKSEGTEMKTELCVLSGTENDSVIYKKAGKIIKDGGLVAFPTETVYGLGGDALNAESSKKIYAAKGRPSDNPLIVHIADMEALAPIVREIPENAYKLAEAFWPGPLTMIFNKSDRVPLSTTGGLDTVAVRMPDHRAALEFIRNSTGYIAAPSANRSGRPSPTLASHVMDDLEGNIEMVIDGGPVGIGVESTIVDLTGAVPMLLRPGYITPQMLGEVIGQIEIDPALGGILPDGTHPKAPGMKYKHYAPKGELYIVSGADEAVAEYINRAAAAEAEKGERVGIIATEESCGRYSDGIVRVIGSRAEEDSIARHLFALLREFDDIGVTRIYSEELDTPRMGMAVMNRLLKAAAHRIIKV